MTTPHPSSALYAERAAAFGSERAAHARRAGLLSNLRLLSFVVFVGALVWLEMEPDTGAALGLAGVALTAFVVLIVVHGRAARRERTASALRALNEEGRARSLRRWSELPRRRETPPPGHPYGNDLDIVGRASLVELMATGTAPGAARLRAWLLAPSAPDTIRARQDAVRELGPRLEFRQRFTVAGRMAGEPEPDQLEIFLAWAEGRPWLRERRWIVWIARILPVATLALILLQLEGVIDVHAWALPVVLGFALTRLHGRSLRSVLDRAAAGEAGSRHYAELIRRFGDEPFESTLLVEIHGELAGAEIAAEPALRRLGRLVAMAELRRKNGLYWAIIHGVTLWDFHVADLLERWQRMAGGRVRRWLELLGEIDALNALAGLAHDQPDWCFPELREGGPTLLEAEGLGHPLLPDATRVCNDVSVGPPGTFLMVTGSNMSGKSTLLRAIGTNAVLAQAGGPVCARRMALPPLDIYTSMRIADSLAEGLSLFMAELQRLKAIVDAAAAERPGRTLLYLLDEILHGTNTAERQVAVRKVIAHLLERRAIGAISTHDLELAESQPLRSSSQAVHFTEQFDEAADGPEMSFDYELRPGVATSTNALKLVRMVGLD